MGTKRINSNCANGAVKTKNMQRTTNQMTAMNNGGFMGREANSENRGTEIPLSKQISPDSFPGLLMCELFYYA